MRAAATISDEKLFATFSVFTNQISNYPRLYSIRITLFDVSAIAYQLCR